MPERNWDAIERDYREGGVSVRAVARRHGLSESAVRQRAKAHGWQRPAGPAPAAPDSTADPVAIVRKHQRAVGRLNRLHDDLADKAAPLVEGAASVRELADAAAAIERLGRIAERLITLERQVFGLDDISPAGDDGLAESLRKARQRADTTPA